jgi:hypothetical protein
MWNVVYIILLLLVNFKDNSSYHGLIKPSLMAMEAVLVIFYYKL